MADSLRAEASAAGLSEYFPAPVEQESTLELQSTSFEHTPDSPPRPIFAVNIDEAQFLYENIVTKREYAKSGVTLSPGSLVIDVGGNIGMFSSWAAEECNGEAHIVAIEPAPLLSTALSLNLRMLEMNYSKLTSTVMQCGLSDCESDSVPFVFYPRCTLWSSAHPDMTGPKVFTQATQLLEINAPNGTKEQGLSFNAPELAQESLQAVTVPVVVRRLSSVLRQLKQDGVLQNSTPIALLKIDVEGAELQVLQGIDDMDWPRIQQICCEVHDSDGKLSKICNLLVERGFHVHSERGPPPFFLIYRHISLARGENGLNWQESEMVHVYATRRAGR